MSDKVESKEAPEAATEEKKGGGLNIAALLPAVVAIVVAPLASWGVTNFVLLPRLEKIIKQTVAVSSPTEAGASKSEETKSEAKAEGKSEAKAEGKSEGSKKEGEAGGSSNSYTFDNLLVNLSGTMGTRFLKTSFIVTGSEANIQSEFESNKDKLKDITLNILSSLTLADIEEPGARNVLREKLVTAYNQALGKPLAKQIWFSDFVVQ
jgi:flagellar FliL protein